MAGCKLTSPHFAGLKKTYLHIITAKMTTGKNDLFYSRLPTNEISLSELLLEDHLFYNIPADWHVIITDVKQSTQAIINGLHETINLVATGSIVAVLNTVYKENLSIPFFFGGDGATFLVPPAILDKSLASLLIHKDQVQRNFGLYLRVGHVPVVEIYEQGHELLISKLKSSELFTIPVLMGTGVGYAEKIIKKDDYMLAYPIAENELDLSGMQCRWNKIKPPENYNEVISLVVIPGNGKKQAVVFKKVIDKLDEIYGTPETRMPITVSRLKLKGTFKKIGLEVRTKLGAIKPFYLLKTWITTLLGSFYFKTKTGKNYLLNLVRLSDTLVIDGKISTVISGTSKQREMLTIALNEMEEQGEIKYGLFVSKESVISCYVRNLNDQHIHFIDGSDGGYTNAASMLKKKIYAV